MAREELTRLLDHLDPETRILWEEFLEAVDADVEERGPVAAREHFERAQRHLLAACWALHLCYEDGEARDVVNVLSDSARTLEGAKALLIQLPKKPGFSQ